MLSLIDNMKLKGEWIWRFLADSLANEFSQLFKINAMVFINHQLNGCSVQKQEYLCMLMQKHGVSQLLEKLTHDRNVTLAEKST